MKLFVVMYDYGYDAKNFEGVFSTQEKAEAYVEKFNKASCGNHSWWEETELDNP